MSIVLALALTAVLMAWGGDSPETDGDRAARPGIAVAVLVVWWLIAKRWRGSC